MLANRSQRIVNQVKAIDTYRRRAGSEQFSKYSYKDFSIKNMSDRFVSIASSDITINSRVLLNDLITSFIGRGGDVSVSDEVASIQNKNNINLISTQKGTYRSKRVYVCCEEHISNFYPVNITKHFAPMFVGRLPYNPVSFVELDYNVKNCINYF